METVGLLLTLALLLGLLFVSEYLTRPRSARWHMRRMTKNLDRLNQTIGQRLTPAFDQATLAIAGLIAAWPKPTEEKESN